MIGMPPSKLPFQEGWKIFSDFRYKSYKVPTSLFYDSRSFKDRVLYYRNSIAFN